MIKRFSLNSASNSSKIELGGKDMVVQDNSCSTPMAIMKLANGVAEPPIPVTQDDFLQSSQIPFFMDKFSAIEYARANAIRIQQMKESLNPAPTDPAPTDPAPTDPGSTDLTE